MLGKLSILSNTFFIAVLILFVCFIVGCSSVISYSSFNKEKDSLKVRKVGVLPFMNESGRQVAGKVVTNIFIYGVYKSGEFVIEEKGNIDQFFLSEKIRNINKLQTHLAIVKSP